MKNPVDRFFSFGLLILLVTLGWQASSDALLAENWPGWRGPSGNGISAEKNVPLTWNETPKADPAKEAKSENEAAAETPTDQEEKKLDKKKTPEADLGIVWKTPIPEWGRSTPVVWDDAIFLTTHVDEDRLVLVKIDKRSGRIEWTRTAGHGQTPRKKMGIKKGDERRHQAFHTMQNLASPSPVTDGRLVVVHFGNGDTAAYDYDGKQLWHRNFQKDYGDYTIWWGHANSPVLYGDLVISIVTNDMCHDLPGEPSPCYVVAHDKRTGREVWRTMRATEANDEGGDGYTTPLLHEVDGHTELIVMGSECLDAYDPATGRRLWYLPGIIGIRPVTGPVAAGRTVFATHGKKGPFIAVRPEGEGKQSEDRILWSSKKGTPDTPCPIVADGVVYWVNDNGIAHALDAQTGAILWKKRLAGGPFRASPVWADGRLYFTGTRGTTTVVRAGREFEKLAENHLDDELYASPVLDDGRIYLRGRKAIYCLGEK